MLRSPSPRAVIAVAGLAAGLGLAAPAHAQSRRYPREPVDKDAESAAKSSLWNAATQPERHPYQDLVRKATDALNHRTPDQTTEAIKKLDAAIRLLPREPEAYRLRGDAYLERKDWPRCAADYSAADANTQRDDETPRAMVELHRKLGLCLARAGKLGEAERTLAETAASSDKTPSEIWMRLGEVRIAMGKLDEAIAALRAALDTNEPMAQAMVHFMLAAAYDRARRPADALAEAAEGLKLDRQLLALQNQVLPPLGAGEIDYMQALAFSTEPVRAEYALAHFRLFLSKAPDSPWRRRAEDHIRDIKTAELPDNIARGGSAPLDLDVARGAVRRMMPQLRACLARFPTVVVEVEIIRSGPRTPSLDRLRARSFTPPDGVTVRVALGELGDRDLDGVDRCVEAQAARIALPPIKERDTFYKATFAVIGP